MYIHVFHQHLYVRGHNAKKSYMVKQCMVKQCKTEGDGGSTLKRIHLEYYEYEHHTSIIHSYVFF